jgi:citrate lyase beta subunit
MGPRLDAATVERLLSGVDEAERLHRQHWPGTPTTRQPLQVLYVPADDVTATTARDHGTEAARLMAAHAPDTGSFAAALGLADGPTVAAVRERVEVKLASEPVEDLRVDFEDGYLDRTPEREAEDAVAAARALAQAHRDGTAPPFCGLRVKSFADGLARRSVATLDRFVTTLLEELGELPGGFVVTFPKIVAVEHVATFASVLTELEAVVGLPAGRLRFEAQIETTPSLLGADGRVVLRDLRAAADGRLCAVHLGVYDYTAGLGLPPTQQRLEHPACDLARHLMQVTFAGTEVRLSDGSSNAVPAADTPEELHRVWARHAATVRHSLAHGYVQGWDLHPSHLVSRYGVVFAELLTDLEDVLVRLARWRAGTGADDTGRQDAGGVVDEPATIRRLEAHLRRALDSGAVDPADVERRLSGGSEGGASGSSRG